ncbi:MAG: glycosyltransferase family A protein [bacterium]
MNPGVSNTTQQANPPGPKVSIGMPVYNGESRVRHALDSLLAQSFADFELIISDNASTDKTAAICGEYAGNDRRIQFHRQAVNKGSSHNFDFVLQQARGEYFMWAAHDDAWDTFFLEKILREFTESDSSVVAVACEAQYTINSQKQPFFPEGGYFYDRRMESPAVRMKYMLKYNYGNLFYSIYRRNSLFIDQKTKLSALSPVSLNEIAFFLLVAAAGNWRVIPDVMFYKETNPATYEQARWEIRGGILPRRSALHCARHLAYSMKYHMLAAIDISKAVNLAELRADENLRLQVFAIFTLLAHCVALILGFKPARRQQSSAV